MDAGGSLGVSGKRTFRLLKGGSLSGTPAKELSLYEILKYGFPHFWMPWAVFVWKVKNMPNLWRGLWRVLMARFWGISIVYGAVSLVLKKADGTEVDYGLASLRLVTTAGVGYIVDAFQNLVEPEDMKFHGFGTGTGAEATGDTALGTELTTQYATDNIRPTGSQTEGAANIYRTVATLSPNAGGTIAVTEHGIFSDADVGQGVLLDRSVFSAVNVVASADSLQVTYDFTVSAGG